MTSTLSIIEMIARRSPGATALVSANEVVSYGALFEAARSTAAKLRIHGLDTVALLADNSTDWVIADLASQLAGASLVPLPSFFSMTQKRHALIDSGTQAILADESSLPLSQAWPVRPLGRLTQRLSLARLTEDFGPVSVGARTAKISYTSGTTGEPKGVCLPQSAMDQVATSLVAATRALDLKRHLCVLPLATLLENVAGVYAPLQLGSEICLPSLAQLGWAGATSLDARALLSCITQYEPDSLILVPQLLHGLLDAIAAGAAAPASLKFVAVGGGHVASATLERAEQIGLPVYVGYGLTEAASVVALSSPKLRRRGSVGRPLAHTNVRIDANSELFVSGAGYCGYAGQGTVPGDEIATGDLGRLDADGFLYILGRRKNIFITSFGRNVDPEWVAAEFSQQATIAQIAVFGEARPWNVAVIVPEAGADYANLGTEIATVNATLPDYAQIGHWIVADENFTLRNGLLTGNGRYRRSAIWTTYRHQIEACYEHGLAQQA